MYSATHWIHKQKQSQCSGNFSPFPKSCRHRRYFDQHAASAPVTEVHHGFAMDTLSGPGHLDTPKVFQSLYFSHPETGIKMSFSYLFPVSVIPSMIPGCSFLLCRVLSSAKLQTHLEPLIHLTYKYKRQTEGLMKCSTSYS